MPMIQLVRTAEPTENVCLEQAQVRVVWEDQNFGFGTLYITEHFVAWISDRSEDGFTLTYPSIGVYGVSSSDHQHPDPSLFMVVDLNKTCIPLAPQSANDGNLDEDEDLAEDGSRTATLRLIPDDSNSLNLITGLMQQCHLLNPDAEDEIIGQNYAFNEETADQSFQPEADDSWFTEETADNEIRLSEEGRSNLERIVGDLNIASNNGHYEPGDQNDDSQKRMNGNQMEH